MSVKERGIDFFTSFEFYTLSRVLEASVNKLDEVQQTTDNATDTTRTSSVGALDVSKCIRIPSTNSFVSSAICNSCTASFHYYSLIGSKATLFILPSTLNGQIG